MNNLFNRLLNTGLFRQNNDNVATAIRETGHLQVEHLEPRMMLNGTVIFEAGFEDANVAAGDFGFVTSVSGFTSARGAVEIQNNHPAVGPAAQGQRHLELDANNEIYVDIDVASATELTLDLQYSPRAGATLRENRIEVLFNGEVVSTLAADGSQNTTTDFQSFSIDLPVDDNSTNGLLAFRSVFSGGRGVGGLLDDIVVTAQLAPLAIEAAPNISINPIADVEAGTVTFSGTSTDNVAIDRNRLLLFNRTTEQYWNGSAWTDQWAQVEPTGIEDWSFTIDLPEGDYRIVARTWDAANNLGFDFINFTVEPPAIVAAPPVSAPAAVDRTAPSISINPIANAEAGAVTFSGTSADNVAVDRNRLLLFNKTTEQYWNGSAWTDQWAQVEPNGIEDWSFTIDLPEGDYRAVARTWDAANNLGFDLINFTVDPTSPGPTELTVAIENLNDSLPDGWTLATRIEGNDIWFRTIDPNGDAEIDFRFGSAGVIAEIREVATGDSLLAPTFGGEVTDRVVQWTLWETGSTVVRDVAVLPEYEDRFNTTQAGTFDNVLHGTVDVDLNAQEGQIDVWAVADHNWKSELEPYIDGTITALTRTEILDGGAILVRRVVRIGEINLNGRPVTLEDPYFESWNPLSDTAFDSLALGINANGTPNHWYADGVNIPFYADLPVEDSRGWTVSYDRNNIANGRNIAVVFGTEKGTVHRADGSETSSRRFDLNLQDFVGGVAVLPGLYPGSLSEGAIIDQHIILLPGNGINAATPVQLDALSAHLPPPQVYHAGAELDGELSAIADRLSGLTNERRVATDNLARLL